MRMSPGIRNALGAAVVFGARVVHFPNDAPFTFRIAPPAVTANPLEACREVVRVLLGDHWAPYEYDNDTVDSGLRAMLVTGELPGYGLAADRFTITPAITSPNVLALLCYKCAKTFVQSERDYAYKARALGESMKERRTLLTELANKVRGLDGSAAGISTGGGGFSSVQNFYTWMLGVAGLPLGAVQARLALDGPNWSIVSVNAGGAHSG